MYRSPINILAANSNTADRVSRGPKTASMMISFGSFILMMASL